jgi:hypothetical protein
VEREKKREAGNAPLPAADPAERRARRRLPFRRRSRDGLGHGDELGNGDGLLELFMAMKPAAGQERLTISSE